MNKLPGSALILGTAFFSLGALAQDKPADFNMRIQAGTQYDSTLTVVELDQTTNKGDWAEVFSGRVGGELRPSDRITLKGSYSFTSRNYLQYNSFDQDLYITSLDAGVDLGGMTAGLSHHFAHAKLASQPLLDLSKTSFYASKLFSGGVYLRGALTENSKRFDSSSERNSDGDEVAADVYYFFNNARTFWSLGVSRETENARSSAFDNDALKLRARYSYTGDLNGHKSRLQLAWRYQDRDYAYEESLLAQGSRRDRSQVVEASWALGLVEWLTLETKVEYGDYSSNLDAADYRETGVSALLSVEF